MAAGIPGLLNGSASSLLGPAVHSGAGFYLVVFLILLLGAVFIITPVPENSVLFLAGALAAGGQVSVAGILVAAVLGAYIGYDLNYWSGRLFSFAVCRKACPEVLSEGNMRRARDLVDRYGPASVVVSRFIPVVNLPPFLAGMDAMDYGLYIVVNLAGAVLWCSLTIFLGYTIGSLDVIQPYIPPLFDLVIIIACVSITYAVVRLVRERMREREAAGE